MKSNTTTLDSDKIIKTIGLLEKRISERFPDSGLRQACNDFLEIANESKKNIEWLATPNYIIRAITYFTILLGVIGIAYTFTIIDFKIKNTTLTNIVPLTEALINDLILIGAAIFFMVSLENRIKRNKAISLLNQLRGIAHVIDMHQLTKDPNLIGVKQFRTDNSPKRVLSKFELQRYLDYCAEFLSLIGKVAALYSQSLPDDGVVRSVNEIESLSSGMSRKVWQKLIILNDMEEGVSLSTSE